MKTSELTGTMLNYWVARAECDAGRVSKVKLANYIGVPLDLGEQAFAYFLRGCWESAEYSDVWAQGGPIIEREKIALSPPQHPHSALWTATSLSLLYERAGIGCTFTGQAALIAAMRAYVASKYGDEVPEIPDLKSEVQ